MNEQTAEFEPRRWSDWLIGVFLLAAAAAVVVWQNSRVGVLWDASYILENATRISQGDAPYRDFPFPYAPLTFLTQALIIKLTGAVFWHHIVYCAIVGGIGSILTWRILAKMLDGKFSRARLAASILALPMCVLGIYCVFPHPFYDPDCTFVILLCILLLLGLDAKNFPDIKTFFVGALCVVPLFIKQNTGLAFLASLAAGVLFLIVFNLWKREKIRGLLILSGGIFTGLIVALSIIELTVGLADYKHWTIDFAASRRTPSASEMLSVYADWSLFLWLALFAVSAVLLWFLREKNYRAVNFFAVALMLASFAWSVVYLLIDADASERAERLAALWSFVLVVALVAAAATFKKRAGVRFVLPFVILATIHGAFLSQQLWGSTYALWALLLILIADVICACYELFPIETSAPTVFASGVIALSLIISGGFYVYSNERLDYINKDDGELRQSPLSPLSGLNIRGEYLADFDELVKYTNENIPREDGILMLPGEDLFYFTTGRHPRFPVLMFDHTVNPLSSEEIVEQARQRDIKWLIVKNDLQLDENPLEDKAHLTELLKQDFKAVESLNNYEIFRRRLPGEKDDEDGGDDNSDDSDDSSN